MIEEKSSAALQRYRRPACSLILAELKLVRWFHRKRAKGYSASLDGSKRWPQSDRAAQATNSPYAESQTGKARLLLMSAPLRIGTFCQAS